MPELSRFDPFGLAHKRAKPPARGSATLWFKIQPLSGSNSRLEDLEDKKIFGAAPASIEMPLASILPTLNESRLLNSKTY